MFPVFSKCISYHKFKCSECRHLDGQQTSYLTNQFGLPESPPCRPQGGSISTFQHQQRIETQTSSRLHIRSGRFMLNHVEQAACQICRLD